MMPPIKNTARLKKPCLKRNQPKKCFSYFRIRRILHHLLLNTKKKEAFNIKYNRLDEVVIADTDKTEVFEDGYVTIRTVYIGEGDYIWELYNHGDEWKYIDQLVFTYQKQFTETPLTESTRIASEIAANTLLERFYPLFKKYVLLLTTGRINYKNTEQRAFVRLFMGNEAMQRALSSKKPNAEMKMLIDRKFNFIVEGYGHQPEEDIYGDMYIIVMSLAKRYKDTGRSFCCYIYNLFKYEMFRAVQAFQEDPANIHYKVAELDDENVKSAMDDYSSIEDIIAEDDQGLPNTDWIRGDACSDLFKQFTPEERMIFSKYYLQNWNDNQVAMLLGIHINTANQKRKAITKKLCNLMGVDPSEVHRHRNSGRKAIVNAFDI